MSDKNVADFDKMMIPDSRVDRGVDGGTVRAVVVHAPPTYTPIDRPTEAGYWWYLADGHFSVARVIKDEAGTLRVICDEAGRPITAASRWFGPRIEEPKA